MLVGVPTEASELTFSPKLLTELRVPGIAFSPGVTIRGPGMSTFIIGRPNNVIATMVFSSIPASSAVVAR